MENLLTLSTVAEGTVSASLDEADGVFPKETTAASQHMDRAMSTSLIGGFPATIGSGFSKQQPIDDDETNLAKWKAMWHSDEMLWKKARSEVKRTPIVRHGPVTVIL